MSEGNAIWQIAQAEVLIIDRMNSSIFGQSREQITQIMSTKMLLQLSTNFRGVRLGKVNDVSCVQVFDNKLYVGSNDSKVFVFELAKGCGEEQELLTTSERSFYPHCTSVHFIVAAPAFLIVVPLEEQQLIRIWNRDTLQILHGYKGHAKQITAVIFLKDNQHIASSSYDATVRVWKISENFEFDLETRKYVGKYPLLSLVEVDGESVALGGDDCSITVWNWTRDVVRHKCFAHPGSVISLSICPPNWLFSMGGDSRIRAWRVEESERTSQNISEMCEQVAQQRLTLWPVKEFNESISQNVFAMHLTPHEILAVDSKGNTFLINRSLEAVTLHLKLDYSETIRSAKIWENRLLVVTYRRGKGELKEVAGDFEEMVSRVTAPRDFIVLTNTTRVISIQTRHSIAIENESTYKELEKISENANELAP